MNYQSYEQDSVEPRIGAPFFQEHLARYLFASKFVQNKKVLELGCGKGYGSFYLAHFANQVVGCDLNQSSLDFAEENYKRPNLRFASHDVNLPDSQGLLGAPFDVIVTHEVLEHLPPELTETFLTSIKKLLKPDGLLLLSTPNHDVVMKSGMPVPEFHINNLTARELRALLRSHFKQTRMYGQVIDRGWLKNLIYGLDVFHLRHAFLGKWFRSQVVFEANPPRPHNMIWRPDQGFDGANRYVFSRLLWRQAGMSYAICKYPRL